MVRTATRCSLLGCLAVLGLGACDTDASRSSQSELPRAASRAVEDGVTLAKNAAPRTDSSARPPKRRSKTASKSSARVANGGEKPQSPFRFPAVPRLVAVGDVHGDGAATVEVLRMVGAIDDQNAWVGGGLVVVQTGDQLDRGDDERAILDMFARLEKDALAAGGAFHVLNGNHELMNAMGDFRYVTAGGFAAFQDIEEKAQDRAPWSAWPPQQRGRALAFAPGGPYARQLAARNLVLIVGDTVFVHGGVHPVFAADVEDLNALSRAWLAGDLAEPKAALERLMHPHGPVWSRDFGDPTVSASACDLLRQSLATLGVQRMVVGHTVQQRGVTSACDERVWRIDVGMAEHYGGQPQALEIIGSRVRVLENHHGPSVRAGE